MLVGWMMDYRSPGGKKVNLVGPDPLPPFAVAAGGLGQLGVNRSVPTLQVVGGVGETALLGRSQVRSVEDNLTVNIRPGGGRSADENLAYFRSLWSHTRHGLLVLDRGRGKRSVPLRLQDGKTISDPEQLGGGFHQVRVPYVADRSGWQVTHTGRGEVTITNTSPDVIVPTVAWEDAGTVTTPTGLTITLPAVEGGRTLSLGRADQCMIYHQGTEDYDLWATMWPQLRPAEVPPGASRVYVTTGDARMSWRMGVDS